MARISAAAALFASIVAAVFCHNVVAEPPFQLGSLPIGLPEIAIGDPASSALVDLGRKLFYDTGLSRDGRVSCATCHDPALAFTDAKPVPIGVDVASGTRNVPTLLNVTYQQLLFWDGRRETLESQAADPLFNVRELGLAGPSELAGKLNADAGYRQLFERISAVAGAEATLATVTQALAAYERTLLAADSPFDRYYYAQQKVALSDSARRGFAVFRGPAHCTQCHTIGDKGALFTDGRFHGGVGLQAIAARLPELTRKALALSEAQLSELVTAEPDLAALGRFLITKDPQDIGKYKTPSLRNVALTPPYMHDGSLATLREAVEYEIYYRSLELGRTLVVTPSERDDLVAFLEALTSPCVAQRNCPGM